MHFCMNVSEQTIRLYHAVNEVFFFFLMHAEQESVKTVWRLQRRVKFNKAIKTEVVSLRIQVLPLSLIWVDLWQGHGNLLLISKVPAESIPPTPSVRSISVIQSKAQNESVFINRAAAPSPLQKQHSNEDAPLSKSNSVWCRYVKVLNWIYEQFWHQ